jgi:hypothetical protein
MELSKLLMKECLLEYLTTLRRLAYLFNQGLFFTTSSIAIVATEKLFTNQGTHAMISHIHVVVKSAIHANFNEFKQECEENHMSLQDHEDPNIVKAWYGEEYMGYFNKELGEGFLLLETMTPEPQSMLH